MMSHGFVVTFHLTAIKFVSIAAAGDGHSAQVAAVHAVLTHRSHRDGPGFSCSGRLEARPCSPTEFCFALCHSAGL